MEDEPVNIPIEDHIDLHSFAPRDVVSVVDEYLQAARDAGFQQVRLIHGRGKGVQRAAVQQLLREHALVERYWDAPESHLGATVVVLRKPEARVSSGSRDARLLPFHLLSPASARAMASSCPFSSETRSVDTGTPEFTADATVR